ncbi:hypothetical protein DL93DRAFT_816408 [Clavulina sp. PMI_390]|nr:hypothetical protein DL93DRAFT_816408 [Clavulina sp. PMI_390]
MPPPTSTRERSSRLIMPDEQGHYRILILGGSSSERRKAARPLARGLNLPVLALHCNNVSPGAPTPTPLSRFSWIAHSSSVQGEDEIECLEAASDVIWLDTPYLANIATRTRHIVSEAARTPSRMLTIAPTKFLAADWAKYSRDREQILQFYERDNNDSNIDSTDDSADRSQSSRKWHRFDGWKGSVEYRYWVSQFEIEAAPVTSWETSPMYSAAGSTAAIFPVVF